MLCKSPKRAWNWVGSSLYIRVWEPNYAGGDNESEDQDTWKPEKKALTGLTL